MSLPNTEYGIRVIWHSFVNKLIIQKKIITFLRNYDKVIEYGSN